MTKKKEEKILSQGNKPIRNYNPLLFHFEFLFKEFIDSALRHSSRCDGSRNLNKRAGIQSNHAFLPNKKRSIYATVKHNFRYLRFVSSF